MPDTLKSRLDVTLKKQLGASIKLSGLRTNSDSNNVMMTCGMTNSPKGNLPFWAIWVPEDNRWRTGLATDGKNGIFAVHSVCDSNKLTLPDFNRLKNPADTRGGTGGNHVLSTAEKALIERDVARELTLSSVSLNGLQARRNEKRAIAVCGFARTSKGNIRFGGYLIGKKRFGIAAVGTDAVQSNAVQEVCKERMGITLPGGL